MSKQKLGPLQRKWLKALRSGKYKQAESALHTFDGKVHRFCCLGVACDVLGMTARDPMVEREGWNPIELYPTEFRYGKESTVLPETARRRLAMYHATGEKRNGSDALTELNDSGKTFKQIANIIEASPDEFFREPR